MEKFIPLNIPLINCEVKLILTWSRSCVLAGMKVRAVPGNNPAIVASSGIKTYQLKNIEKNQHQILNFNLIKYL